MQYAQCTVDNKIWEASEFAKLSDLKDKRDKLICIECHQDAWFRKEGIDGRSAHFSAHHIDDCKFRVEYIVVNDQKSDAALLTGNGDTIIVQLDQEQGGAIDVPNIQVLPDYHSFNGSRKIIIDGSQRESTQQARLRKILYRLVKSPNFRNSNQNIIFYKNETDILIDGQVRDVIVSFADIRPEIHNNSLRLYWGMIASAGQSTNGTIWLNSSSYQSTSIIALSTLTDI